MAGLRTLAWQGGIAMTVRQVVGMAISFGGLVALARLIGPQAYGVYVSALALHTFLVMFFQWGTDIFLVRRRDDPTAEHVDQALTLSLALGAIGVVLAWPAGAVAERWIGSPGVALAVAALFSGMPLQLASMVPSAVLQRRMAYRRIAWAELAGHVALYGVAVAAALAGLGLTAPLMGWWAQQIVHAVILFPAAGLHPRLVWRPALIREVLSYGLGYSASIWAWQLRTLVNPLIVARLLGPEAAANVAVAVRMVDSLSFMRVVLMRVALPALGRLQADRERLARAVGEGMRFQVLAVAPLIAVFSLLAPWLVPFAFGKAWIPVVTVFPWLAAASLASCLFSLQSSALSVLGHNRLVATFHLVHVTMLVTATALLVPRHGLVGYGLAETAAIASYLLLRRMAQRELGPIAIGLPAAWAAGFALPLFADSIGPLAVAGPLAVLLLPATWRTLAGWWTQVKEASHG
jgi:PST family polysaccharide transporter